MYSKAKYAVGEVAGSYGSTLCAIVFSEVVTHSDTARVFVPGTIMSAGFFHADQDKVHVYGDSVSLNVKSNPERDERLIGRAIAHPAYVL